MLRYFNDRSGIVYGNRSRHIPKFCLKSDEIFVKTLQTYLLADTNWRYDMCQSIDSLLSYVSYDVAEINSWMTV